MTFIQSVTFIHTRLSFFYPEKFYIHIHAAIERKPIEFSDRFFPIEFSDRFSC
jgi:hypothetical protein